MHFWGYDTSLEVSFFVTDDALRKLGLSRTYTKSHGSEPVCPLAQANRHNLPGLIDEAVPRFAAMVDEVVVGVENPVRQPVVAQELPDVFDRVQLRAFRGQRHERDGGRHDEMARQVPSGLVQEENGMLAGRNLGRDLGQVQGHRLGVATGQDERCTFAVVRAYGSEDVGRGGALIVGSAGPRPASGPAPRELVLLADPGLVGEPEFYVADVDALLARDLCQAGWEIFLKTSIAPLA